MNIQEKIKYIFMDIEFDCNKDYTEILSIGAIKTDKNFNIIDKFYSLSKPLIHKRINPCVKELTGLEESLIYNDGKELSIVIKELSNWLEHFKGTDIFVWGSEDKRVLEQSIKMLNMTSKYKFITDNIVNIQTNLCKDIFNSDKITSLDNMKYLYAIEGKVKHQALSDAIDLMNVYKSYKTNPIDVDRLLTISNKRKRISKDYKAKLENIFEHIIETYNGKLELELSNSLFQKFLVDIYINETIKLDSNNSSDKVTLRINDNMLNIHYKYEDNYYYLNINREDIYNEKSFYKHLKSAIENNFINNNQGVTLTLENLDNNQINFLDKHDIISHMKSNNIINKYDSSLSYININKEEELIKILDEDKNVVIEFKYDFNSNDSTFFELICKLSIENPTASKTIHLNDEIIEALRYAVNRDSIYSDIEKSQIISAYNFESDIKDLSKKLRIFSIYGKYNFRLIDDKIQIKKTKNNKEEIKLYLTEEDKKLLIEYLTSLTKTKKNKHVTISEEKLLGIGVTLSCNNKGFSQIIERILNNKRNADNFSYKIKGDEIIIVNNFNYDSINNIKISTGKNSHVNHSITLSTHHSSKKYFLDEETFKIINTYFKVFISNRWMDNKERLSPLTKRVKQLINTMYKSGILKIKPDTIQSSLEILSYKFNGSLYLLFTNNKTKVTRKLKLRKESEINEFTEFFFDIDINNII